MNRCRTCKYFDIQGATRLALPPGWKECQLAESRDGRSVHPKSLAVAVDVDEYAAILNVSPDFGCVQHEEREGAKNNPRTKKGGGS